jgi:hypothetical protein
MIYKRGGLLSAHVNGEKKFKDHFILNYFLSKSSTKAGCISRIMSVQVMLLPYLAKAFSLQALASLQAAYDAMTGRLSHWQLESSSCWRAQVRNVAAAPERRSPWPPHRRPEPPPVTLTWASLLKISSSRPLHRMVMLSACSRKLRDCSFLFPSPLDPISLANSMMFGVRMTGEG